MGVCYMLLDLKNHRRFDLDKGGWYSLCFDGGQAFTVNEVYAACCKARPQAIDMRDVAERVWAFCDVAEWDIQLHNDHGDYDDDAMMTWPVIDARCRMSTDVMDEDPCELRTAAALKMVRSLRCDITNTWRSDTTSEAERDALWNFVKAHRAATQELKE